MDTYAVNQFSPLLKDPSVGPENTGEDQPKDLAQLLEGPPGEMVQAGRQSWA